MGQPGIQQRIIGLHAQGKSVREIAAELALSKSTVGRVLKAEVQTTPKVQGAQCEGGVLTGEELQFMGWTPAKVARGLSDLDVYRLRAVAAHRVAGEPLPDCRESAEQITQNERDEQVIQLRDEGYTLAAIAEALPPVLTRGGGKAVKMTVAGVAAALKRLNGG